LYTAVILVKVTQFSKDAWCSDSKEITTFRQRVFVAFVKQVTNVRPTDRQTDRQTLCLCRAVLTRNKMLAAVTGITF